MPADETRRVGLSVALALPIAGLALLIARPALDVAWEHHPAHFWLVLTAGALSAVLAYATGTAAHRRGDARVFLVSLAFLAAAGFLGLHALATPGVVVAGPNTGFTIAPPVGLLIAGAFAAASSINLSPAQAHALIRRSGLVRGLLLAVLVVWGVASVVGVPPLNHPTPPERASGPLVTLSAGAFVLYAVAVARYLRIPRHPGSVRLLIAMASSFVLLAEAAISVAIGRNWHTSWWLWHLLMLVAFALVAATAQNQWYEERFSPLYLDETLAGTREASILFADLQGFTSFSEAHNPQEVTAMLNEYFTSAIPPVVKRFGGEVDRIIGDALMAIFNIRGDQPDHALQAARAALAIQRITAEIARDHPNWPRFRVGVNTGDAAVGLLGTAGGRTYTAIGDAVNLAARLEGAAPVGGVVIGPETARRIPSANLEPMGPIQVKGRTEPVEVYRLLDA